MFRHRPHAPAPLPEDPERGDVPGWVLITLMTAALVVAIWTVAQTRLVEVFQDALNKVSGI
ncbi:hypothetical protein I6B53_03075 [Schaalia sp. 19OD2882]|uniref:hypothetical protein n=1 Tax=Schaalia sp. 19OD2882 TaxID=2794089 RepID=UPI001C1EAA94|nr:hypothetical protein [Schaalia sp. 19OD2882]QWW20097.1 hypothetical protein I6B53_03075 [Schaalia sp. 19OD2882]